MKQFLQGKKSNGFPKSLFQKIIIISIDIHTEGIIFRDRITGLLNMMKYKTFSSKRSFKANLIFR